MYDMYILYKSLIKLKLDNCKEHDITELSEGVIFQLFIFLVSKCSKRPEKIVLGIRKIPNNKYHKVFFESLP